MTLGDRLVVMRSGEVQQIGTPTEIYSKPVNTFVAGFIGLPAMNLFEGGRLELRDGRYTAVLGPAVFELDDFQQKALKAGGRQPCAVTVGIRPQDVTVGRGELEAVVEISEMLGSEVNLHARFGDREIFMVVPMSELRVGTAPGEKVRFGAPSGAVQLFDADTGRNLIWYDEESARRHEPVCKTYDRLN